jgi:hypothetical protein
MVVAGFVVFDRFVVKGCGGKSPFIHEKLEALGRMKTRLLADCEVLRQPPSLKDVSGKADGRAQSSCLAMYC